MLNVVIFAAGHGTRMKTDLPKVLHKVAGRPMLALLIDSIITLNPNKIIITCSYQKDMIIEQMSSLFQGVNFQWVEQKEVLGTAQAMNCVLPYLDENANCLVMCGDMPFIQDEHTHEVVTTKTLKDFIVFHQQANNHMTIMSNFKSDPAGYGRIVRKPIHMLHAVTAHDDAIVAITEQQNLSAEQKDIKEINTGVYLFNSKLLQEYIPKILPNGISGEYYLTDIVEIIRDLEQESNKTSLGSFILPTNLFFAGANSQLQLVQIERKYQLFLANTLLNSGVRLFDVNRVDIRGHVVTGKNCVIDVNCVFEGNVELGHNVTIGMGCYLKDVKIADNVTIKSYSVIENSVIKNDAQIGPFSRLRPGTILEVQSKVGNFVEIKNSKLGANTKVSHLSYVGDAKLGDNVNIGAGVVVCNYDGVNKHHTTIEDHVFVGSGTMLIAPLHIGKSSLIAAGSTINKDVPANELTIARAKQITKYGWLHKKRKR